MEWEQQSKIATIWDNVYNYNTQHKEYNLLQALIYNQIQQQQQQKNIEQPRNISQTLNRETTATATIVVVDPRRTCKSYSRQEFGKVFSDTHYYFTTLGLMRPW